MSAKSPGFLQRILIWSYDRGTIPYDVICVLILAFIFFTPRSCFHRKTPAVRAPGAAESQALAPAGR